MIVQYLRKKYGTIIFQSKYSPPKKIQKLDFVTPDHKNYE